MASRSGVSERSGSGSAMLHRVAVLSDVHANLVALQAVLADLDALGVDQIVAAGDAVGFGPNPDEVVDLLVARGARMIRGNHETDYVSVYATPQMPDSWRTNPCMQPLWWTMERLGAKRRALLAGLSDRLCLDEATLIAHGSPRHVRDAILAETSEHELEVMFAGERARLIFVGHTHKVLIRDLPERRVVNVGSVGLPLDGDPRAAYVVAVRSEDGQPGAWELEVRRVDFDVEAAIAAYDSGLRIAHPWLTELIAAELRSGINHFGRWLHIGQHLPADELLVSVRHYLAARQQDQAQPG